LPWISQGFSISLSLPGNDPAGRKAEASGSASAQPCPELTNQISKPHNIKMQHSYQCIALRSILIEGKCFQPCNLYSSGMLEGPVVSHSIACDLISNHGESSPVMQEEG